MKYLKKITNEYDIVEKSYHVCYYNSDENEVIINSKPNIVLYYTDGTIKKYMYETELTWQMIDGKDESWRLQDTLYKVELNDGVTSINDDALHYCIALSSVTMADSVTNIGKNGFYYCQNLSMINSENEGECNLSNGLTTIGVEAFRQCPKIVKLNMPDTVTEIYEGAFWGCSAMTEIHLSDSLTELKNLVLAHCYKLQSITIPKNVKKIDMSFLTYTCSSITKVDYYAEVIVKDPFASLANNITSVTLHEGVKEIESEELTEVLYDIEFPLCKVLARMEALQNIRVDETVYRPIKPEELYLSKESFDEKLQAKKAVFLLMRCKLQAKSD